MTIRHLRVFTAVADSGSMSGAAKELHVSQPTVSQAVAELEKYYGVRLFERLSQKLYLTKEGELMLSFSRHLLDSFDKMEEAMVDAAKRPLIRIGCSVTVGTCLIQDLLDLAEKQMPQVSFQVVVANSSEIERAILTHEVDLGIVEGILESKELSVTPVCEDELVVVCGKDFPLAGEQHITLEQLNGQNYISRESGSTDRNQLEKLFEEQGIQLVRSFCSTNTEAIKNAVLRGRGIAILSGRMIEKERKAGEIVVLEIEGVKATRSIMLAIHKNKYISPNMKRLIEMVQSSFTNR